MSSMIVYNSGQNKRVIRKDNIVYIAHAPAGPPGVDGEPGIPGPDNLPAHEAGTGVHSIAGTVGLQEALDLLSSGLTPRGDWDADGNLPVLPGTAETGDFWIVSVDGSTNLDGITDWVTNDWAVKTATGWAKIDNTDKVLSVAGKTGAVVLQISDISGLQSAIADAEEHILLVTGENPHGTTHESLPDKGTLTHAEIETSLDSKVDNSRVLTDVPAGALFTDTIYDDTAIQAELSLKENAGTAQAMFDTLATVAVTGVYDDLSNKPDLSLLATNESFNAHTAKPQHDFIIRTITATTETATSLDCYISIDTSNNDVALTLPEDGVFMFKVRHDFFSTGDNVATITNTIDGEAGPHVIPKGYFFSIVFDGTRWIQEF
jgi:hypothetical protein